MRDRRPLLSAIAGRTLIAASVSFHTMYGERRAHDVGLIWLLFDHDLGIGLRTAGDGFLIVDTDQPESVDMGEWGRLQVESAESISPFAACVGQMAVGVNVLALDGANCGVEIVFQATRLIVLNWGDDLYVESNLDAEFLRGEAISKVSL